MFKFYLTKFLLGFNMDIHHFKNHCYNAEVHSNDTIAVILIATVQVSISPLFGNCDARKYLNFIIFG